MKTIAIIFFLISSNISSSIFNISSLKRIKLLKDIEQGDTNSLPNWYYLVDSSNNIQNQVVYFRKIKRIIKVINEKEKKLYDQKAEIISMGEELSDKEIEIKTQERNLKAQKSSRSVKR